MSRVDLSLQLTKQVAVAYDKLVPALQALADAEDVDSFFNDEALKNGYKWDKVDMDLLGKAKLSDIKASLLAVTSIPTVDLDAVLKATGFSKLGLKEKRVGLARALIGITRVGAGGAWEGGAEAGVAVVGESSSPTPPPSEVDDETTTTHTAADIVTPKDGARAIAVQEKRREIEAKKRKLANFLAASAVVDPVDEEMARLDEEGAQLDAQLAAADQMSGVAEMQRSPQDVKRIRMLEQELQSTKQFNRAAGGAASSNSLMPSVDLYMQTADPGSLPAGCTMAPTSREGETDMIRAAVLERQIAARSVLRATGAVTRETQLVNANRLLPEQAVNMPSDLHLQQIRKGKINFPLAPMLQGTPGHSDAVLQVDSTGKVTTGAASLGKENPHMSIEAWEAAIKMLAEGLLVTSNHRPAYLALLGHIKVVRQLAFWYQAPDNKDLWRRYDLCVRNEATTIKAHNQFWVDFSLNEKFVQDLYTGMQRTKCILCASTTHYAHAGTCDPTEPAPTPSAATTGGTAGGGAAAAKKGPAADKFKDTVCEGYQKEAGAGCWWSKKHKKVCKMKHECSKCGKPHPLVECPDP